MLTPIEIIVVLICGAAAILGFFKFKDKKKRIIENGIEVTGIVFNYSPSHRGFSNDWSGGSGEPPTIRYVTKEGVWMTEKADYDPSTLFLKQGQEVTVIYNADNPKEKTSVDLSKVAYLFLIVGLAALAVGLWFAYKYLNK